MTKENVEIRPSQLINLGLYVVCFLTCWLIFPIFMAIWNWLVIKNESYILNKQTLTLHSGVLNKKIDDVELYRIKDIQLKRSLFLRLFGLGNIYIVTSDVTNQEIVLRAIPNSVDLRMSLREMVEASRKERGVREFDMH